jgi:hypothetical protein
MSDNKTEQWFYGYLMYALITCFSAVLLNSGQIDELPGWLYTLVVLLAGVAIGKAHALLPEVIAPMKATCVEKRKSTHADYIDGVVIERR